MSIHQNVAIIVTTLSLMLVSSPVLASDTCEALTSASAEEAVKALDSGQLKTAECAMTAFQLIHGLPSQDAIPILIRLLGYKRPLREAERQGFLKHGPLPDTMYPAVKSLYQIGTSAEPALIEVIAQTEDKNSIEYKNALYTLRLIRHFDVVPTIRLLRKRSLSLAGTPAATRLESAAVYLQARYCTGERSQRCEERLKSDEDN